jgi:hypothetical protein
VSNPESFIDEVSEEVRRDQLFAMMKRYGWIAVLLVVVLVGGAAWTEYSRAKATAAAQATGDGILAALEFDDNAQRSEALAALPASAITALMTSSELQLSGDLEAAAAALDGLVADMTVAQVYRDIAAFKAILLRHDVMSPEDRKIALALLAAPGGELRLLAMEQMALADIELGDIEAALAGLTWILEDAGVTRGLRDRASSLIVALGGEVPAVVSGNVLANE